MRTRGHFFGKKKKLQPGQAVVAVFRMRNLNSSDSKQVCLVPNPNSQSTVILCRSFSVTRNGMCASVLLNTGHHGFNPAWKEAWLHFADKD